MRMLEVHVFLWTYFAFHFILLHILSYHIFKNPEEFQYNLLSTLHSSLVNYVFLFFSQILLPIQGRSRQSLTSATRQKSAASWTSTLRMPPWTKVKSEPELVASKPNVLLHCHQVRCCGCCVYVEVRQECMQAWRFTPANWFCTQ